MEPKDLLRLWICRAVSDYQSPPEMKHSLWLQISERISGNHDPPVSRSACITGDRRD